MEKEKAGEKNEIQGRMTESNEVISAEQRHNLLLFLFPMILPGSPTLHGIDSTGPCVEDVVVERSTRNV